MYIEFKGDGLSGSARIGLVKFSKTGRTLYYKNKILKCIGSGYKYNHYDMETEEHYWISGPKKDGMDRLYNERTPVEIDENIREEYWTNIQKKPQFKNEKVANKISTYK